jgi:hypothetical protein
MPADDANHAYVSWGRYDAEHQALIARVGALERFRDGMGGANQEHISMTARIGTLEQRAEALRGAEEEHASMAARISALEQAGKADAASERGRRDRVWVLGLAIISGLVLPLLTTAVIAFLHLRSVR